MIKDFLFEADNRNQHIVALKKRLKVKAIAKEYKALKALGRSE
jgi:hypothetical protein